jgi:hypothetical protein
MRGSGLPVRLAAVRSNTLIRVTGSTKAVITQQALQQAVTPGPVSNRPYSALSSRFTRQLNYNYVQQPVRQSREVFQCHHHALIQLLAAGPRRRISSTKPGSREASRRTADEGGKGQREEESKDDEEGQGFARSEKASRAAQVNLSARLNKDGLAQGNKPGVSETWRLIKIARPEAKYLGGILTCIPLVRMEGC